MDRSTKEWILGQVAQVYGIERTAQASRSGPVMETETYVEMGLCSTEQYRSALMHAASKL